MSRYLILNEFGYFNDYYNHDHNHGHNHGHNHNPLMLIAFTNLQLVDGGVYEEDDIRTALADTLQDEEVQHSAQRTVFYI